MTIGSLALFGYAIDLFCKKKGNTFLCNPFNGVVHAEVSSSHPAIGAAGLRTDRRYTVNNNEVHA